MGSFDVSCGISGITVNYGSSAGVILLQDPPYYAYNPNYGKFYGSVSGLHVPYLPPIRGTYGDYGELEDIVPSATTEYLEKKFGKPVDVILRCVGNYDRNIHDKYGPMVEHFETEPEPRSVHDLEKIGFTKVDDATFAFSDYVLKVEDDRRWMVVHNNGTRETKINASDFQDALEKFSLHTGKVPGFKEEDWQSIVALRKMNGMFFHGKVFDHMQNTLDSYQDTLFGRWYEMDELKKNLAVYVELNTSTPRLSKGASEEEWSAFTEHSIKTNRVQDELRLWRELFSEFDGFASTDERVLPELKNMADLTVIMRSVNRMYAPTFCGEQHGNDRASKELAGIVAKIADERIEDY